MLRLSADLIGELTMDDVEKAIFDAGQQARTIAENMRFQEAIVRNHDHALADRLVDEIKRLDDSSDQLMQIASRWHEIPR
jgi:hypothetical protein